MSNEILDSTEAAELFKVSVAYLRTLASNGVIPASQFGSEWRFVKSDLLDYLRDRSRREQASRKFQYEQNQKLEKIVTNKRGRPRKTDVIAFLHNKQTENSK